MSEYGNTAKRSVLLKVILVILIKHYKHQKTTKQQRIPIFSNEFLDIFPGSNSFKSLVTPVEINLPCNVFSH